jgi:hypothetical protein
VILLVNNAVEITAQVALQLREALEREEIKPIVGSITIGVDTLTIEFQPITLDFQGHP